ncbi:putative Beta-amylase 2, chloroplastic [Blattamonas nauphoetae]|uniref:Beta-amylase n=1 Tax=Blattamonas nauphoetae TaxID=2049346 RepID=A0ABQ9Y0J0_9EUKA|nr:putative Beta-amylase 2, chloroplastic [Blattamonas nauphoetae]
MARSKIVLDGKYWTMIRFIAFYLTTILFGTHTDVMLPLTTVSSSGVLDQNVVNKLAQLKSANIHGVMVDVWWGLVEASPKTYNFAPYVQLADACNRVGLKLACVMSFHRCGGNVGDTCMIPIPSWLPRTGVYYKDQWGHEDTECLSLSADATTIAGGRNAIQMYKDFMQAFKNAMGSRIGNSVTEVQVGCGPAGELRYPGYQLDRWSFPGVGAFQCFDAGMLASFKEAARKAGHPEWDSPPTDAGGYNSRPGDTNFFNNGQFSEYGKFFMSWYQNRLLEHGKAVLTAANAVFKSGSNQCDVACKIAGIHWWARDRSRAAEGTTGYYMTNGNNFYLTAAQMFKSLNVIFDFTCFEMRNQEQPSSAACGPEDIVYTVLQACKSSGCMVAAENALPRYDTTAYGTILNNCKKGTKVNAVTYLRLTDELTNNNENWKQFQLFVRQLASL